ncbi:RNA polymerase sigma factor SigJ [Nesterenkonia populi]
MDTDFGAGLEAHRPRLRALAYRMLGTAVEAEDAVQEAFVRFLRLTQTAQEEIGRLDAWLLKTTSRVALDELKSARARRIDYVGEWLPEPVPANSDYAGRPADPETTALTRDSLTYGLLVLLERLTPAERAVYVLREAFELPYSEIADTVGRSDGACRQLRASAQQRLERQKPRSVTRQEHDDVVRAFATACATGDAEGLTKVLDPTVTVRSDGGGKVSAARRPVVGAENVARLLLGLRSKYPEAALRMAELPGQPAVVLMLGPDLGGVLACQVGTGGVEGIWIMRNPDKLTQWGQA